MFRLRAKVSRSGVAEWEEPRHPGPASQSAKYPTTSHSATQLSSFAPQDLNVVSLRTSIRRICRRFGGGARSCTSAGGWHERLQPRRLHEKLRNMSRFPGRQSSGTIAGMRAAATRSRTAGTSRRATTSWICGAARAAASAARCARARSRGARLRGQRGGERSAVAVGAVQRGDEGRDAGGGAPPLERGVGAWRARRRAPSRPPLAAARRRGAPRCRAPTSPSARAGDRPAATATRRRSSTSASSASIVAARRAVRRCSQTSGPRKRDGGQREEEREAEAPGRGRQRGHGDGSARPAPRRP